MGFNAGIDGYASIAELNLHGQTASRMGRQAEYYSDTSSHRLAESVEIKSKDCTLFITKFKTTMVIQIIMEQSNLRWTLCT